MMFKFLILEENIPEKLINVLVKCGHPCLHEDWFYRPIDNRLLFASKNPIHAPDFLCPLLSFDFLEIFNEDGSINKNISFCFATTSLEEMKTNEFFKFHPGILDLKDPGGYRSGIEYDSYNYFGPPEDDSYNNIFKFRSLNTTLNKTIFLCHNTLKFLSSYKDNE